MSKKKPKEPLVSYSQVEVKFYILAKMLFNINALRAFASVQTLLTCMVSANGWDVILGALTGAEGVGQSKRDRLFLAYLRELRGEATEQMEVIDKLIDKITE